MHKNMQTHAQNMHTHAQVVGVQLFVGRLRRCYKAPSRDFLEGVSQAQCLELQRNFTAVVATLNSTARAAAGYG